MKPTTIGVLIGAVAITIIVLVVAMGMIPGLSLNDLNPLSPGDVPPGGSCDYSDNDIWIALNSLTGKTLNLLELQQYISTLHIQMCSVDGLNYMQTLNWYKTYYSGQQLVFLNEAPMGGGNWSAVVASWRNGDNTVGYGLISGGGGAVTAIYGHDTMLLKGYGPPQTWTQFVNWLTT